MLITSLAGGGAEKAASELSLNLAENVQRRIITLTNKISYPSNIPPISMKLTLKDTGVITMSYAAVIGIIKYRKILNIYKPDVSLSFLVLDNLINVLSNIGNNKTKVILSVHTVLSMKFRKSRIGRYGKFGINILYNKADLIIVVSRGIRAELIRDYNINPKKIRVVYNPLDIEKIQYLAKDIMHDTWFDKKLPIIINMGRLMEAKGQWHLIRAFSKVRERKQCKLVICGIGELKSYFVKLIKDLNLTNDVIFLGWLDNPFKYISKASIFVSSSIWEALPYALIEAMACGCPVIATDCKYGPREILGNGKFGILVPPMDGRFYEASDTLTPEEDCLANEIIRLLEDGMLRRKISKKGKKRATDFSKYRVNEVYKQVIQEIINL